MAHGRRTTYFVSLYIPIRIDYVRLVESSGTKVPTDTLLCSKMRWFLGSQDLPSKSILYFGFFPHALQHLANAWPIITAEQLIFPKVPQGLTTTITKDSEVFKMLNLKQIFKDFFPPAEFLRACTMLMNIVSFQEWGGVVFCIPQISLTIELFLAEAPYGTTSSLYSGKRAY